MNSFKRASNLTGIAVFIMSFIVYFLTVERTGSLWDCGEFILGAYKLQVVHPPGASIFVLIGRMFTWVAELISDNPSDIAFSINLMSGMFSAMMAGLVASMTMIFGKIILVGRNGETNKNENILLSGTGLVGGLTAAFCTSIWFSAVEGEVYSMSTFFTALTMWAAVKWYSLPNERTHDRWLVFAAYSGGLSIGVHLLSILTFPAIALLYYFKKYEKPTIKGAFFSMFLGAIGIIFVMKVVIVGIPTIWKNMEMLMVNGMGMPFHYGVIPTVLLIGALIFFLLRYCHQKGLHSLQLLTMSALMTVIAFSTLGVIVIRANADTPVNMNVPSDATRLIPYLNREQYGERPLLFGPHYEGQPSGLDKEERYGILGDRYEIVDDKFDYIYKSSDKILFPRIGHSDSGRPALHNQWRKYLNNGETPKGKPGQLYNLGFMWNYQVKWMYFRYFMWNFTGRQNGKQGYHPWDKSKGHWVSGIKFIDDMRLYNSDLFPEYLESDAHNKYYFIPFLLGLLGLFFHWFRTDKEFGVLLILFLITGLGIIIYSNQPPNEPRERDYVLAGSFFTFSIWVGLGVLALYSLLKEKLNMSGIAPVAGSIAIGVVAPALMLFQNFDDHDRSSHTAARDYAANFLESCAPNALIFTYGDNDTYPLWYAQEVEGIRLDVRVINLSLITVDWYIDKMRRALNESAPIKVSISSEAYRGRNRNQMFFINRDTKKDQTINIYDELKFIGSPKSKYQDQFISRTRKLVLPIDKERIFKNGILPVKDTANIVPAININFGNDAYITKDQLAIMDIIANNIYDRPIYFAITSNPEKLLGLQDYMQMEGLGLRVVPVKSSSDRTLYIYGSGRVDAETVYDNVMTKWKWGNFDKEDTYVNTSYGAEVQAMKMVMLRASADFAERGEFEKAANMAEKYFEAFPNFNFPYDSSIFPFINILIKSNRMDSAKKHLRLFSEVTAQKLAFYDSLEEDAFNSFKDDFGYSMRGADDALRSLDKIKDPSFSAEIEKLLGDYDIQKMQRNN